MSPPFEVSEFATSPTGRFCFFILRGWVFCLVPSPILFKRCTELVLCSGAEDGWRERLALGKGSRPGLDTELVPCRVPGPRAT